MTVFCAPAAGSMSGSAASPPAATRQLVLPLRPESDKGFDSFVTGDNAAALACLTGEALGARPVYLWGEAGTGKSHLLAAAARRARDAGVQVERLGPARLLPWPEPADDRPTLFVIDDVDGLSPDQQHAAFSLLVRAGAPLAAMIAAGRRPPVDLPLREDLRTRLAQGLVFQIHALDDDGVRHVLTAEALRRGLVLGPDVSHYLVTHFARDLASLMQLLDRLDHFALAQQRALTIPLLKQMLAAESGPSA